MNNLKIIVAFFVLVSFIIIPAYGDGLASETLPPSIIGNKNVTLSINSSPFLIDNNHVGTLINFVLIDVANQQPIPDATIAVSVFKGDNAIFGHVFISDSGNFLLSLIPDNSSKSISINEEGVFGGFLGHGGNYEINGPIFSSGGLYRFKIEILTMGDYNNQVSKSYNAAISIPETKQYKIYDKENGNQNVTIIAFYDQIGNFYYDSDKKSISFSMPFDWSGDNVKQVSVIHQEIKIPKSFSDFIVTKYDAHVNGVKLNDKAISIDDYSSDDRIVHLILYKQDLENVVNLQQNPKPEMDFTVSPSNETGFPIMQYTTNAQYKVSLSWDPPKILPGSTTRFSFQVLDPYLINKTVDSISYGFTIIAGNTGPVFHTSGQTSSEGKMSTVDVPIPANYTGPITIAFENLNGNSFADSEFSGVVSNPPVVPEFPTGIFLIIAFIFSFTIAFPRLVQRQARI